MKNWERIHRNDCNDLLRAAYEESTHGNLPWASSIRQMFETNGMMETFLTAGTETQESELPHILLFQRLKDQFNQEALGDITRENSKLKFYSALKTELGTEKYLTDVTNVKHRTDLTRLRLSCHSLNIETGRYTRPETAREDRICTLCNTNTVEDETHILVNCPCYENIRTEHIQETILTSDMTDHDKAVKILKSEDLKPIAKFVHEIFETRDTMLDSLSTLNDMIDKIEKQEVTTAKIEADVQKTVSGLISKIIKSEGTYNVTNFDDQVLRMVVSKPKQKIYKISSVNEAPLKFIFSVDN